MLGIRFIKVEPTTYLLQYKKGTIVREGSGMTFFYYAPTSLLAAVPMTSTDTPFIFNEATSDFQEITVQGQVTYRITDPQKVSKLLNFSIDARTHEYVSDDPQKLSQRLINVIQVLTRAELQKLTLQAAIASSDTLVEKLTAGLRESNEIKALGIEIMGLSILAIRPNPETGRALEAPARELLLRQADEAIYARRNSAVEQERAIRENELNTEIAVENKKRQIREAQMDAEMAVLEKRRQMREAEMESDITLEQRNKDLVQLKSKNVRVQADAKAYDITATMKALDGVDPKIIQALAGIGMDAGKLIALAFQGIAEHAEKVGQLNVTPDLLKQLLDMQSE